MRHCLSLDGPSVTSFRTNRSLTSGPASARDMVLLCTKPKHRRGECDVLITIVYGVISHHVTPPRLAMFELSRMGLHCSFAKVGVEESFATRLRNLQDLESSNVYMSNLPFDVDEERLGVMFSQGGRRVISQKILRDFNGMSRGVGFVRFDTRETAQSVIESFHGVILPGGTAPLQVRFADSLAQKQLKGEVAGRRRDVRLREGEHTGRLIPDYYHRDHHGSPQFQNFPPRPPQTSRAWGSNHHTLSSTMSHTAIATSVATIGYTFTVREPPNSASSVMANVAMLGPTVGRPPSLPVGRRTARTAPVGLGYGSPGRRARSLESTGGGWENKGWYDALENFASDLGGGQFAMRSAGGRNGSWRAERSRAESLGGDEARPVSASSSERVSGSRVRVLEGVEIWEGEDEVKGPEKMMYRLGDRGNGMRGESFCDVEVSSVRFP
ncbi:hypothetical protein M427DRAFT_401537 [Gonapodya prolifera JEL478]|uniref:RRM domain-containing protein n=1 Tax=Gonapodya prolifera (strain JEL478) TaxID=1344416 RepID=A0A139AUA5_GONPJ|nr:hypothetical protein M427DRAFT_401537 [Gonapodya prolifera JEL478]|eukprot:KXS20075.1 hypothetical protein M427DRAFT_401537 [Gonapodya prolifera JEL478]